MGVGFVAALLKGLDYEVAIVLATIAVSLFVCRHRFYRKGSLLHEPFTSGWIAAVPAGHDLFDLRGPVCPQARGVHGQRVVGVCLARRCVTVLAGERRRRGHAAAIRRLEAPHAHPPDIRPNAWPGTWNWRPPSSASRPTPWHNWRCWATSRSCSTRTARPSSCMPNKAVRGSPWEIPWGRSQERAELVWGFRELVDQYDGWPVFYQVDEECLPIYLDQGLTLLKLGEEARVPLEDFSLEGRIAKAPSGTPSRPARTARIRSDQRRAGSYAAAGTQEYLRRLAGGEAGGRERFLAGLLRCELPDAAIPRPWCDSRSTLSRSPICGAARITKSCRST